MTPDGRMFCSANAFAVGHLLEALSNMGDENVK
jgi:hypothetical protein